MHHKYTTSVNQRQHDCSNNAAHSAMGHLYLNINRSSASLPSDEPLCGGRFFSVLLTAQNPIFKSQHVTLKAIIIISFLLFPGLGFLALLCRAVVYTSYPWFGSRWTLPQNSLWGSVRKGVWCETSALSVRLLAANLMYKYKLFVICWQSEVVLAQHISDASLCNRDLTLDST